MYRLVLTFLLSFHTCMHRLHMPRPQDRLQHSKCTSKCNFLYPTGAGTLIMLIHRLGIIQTHTAALAPNLAHNQDITRNSTSHGHSHCTTKTKYLQCISSKGPLSEVRTAITASTCLALVVVVEVAELHGFNRSQQHLSNRLQPTRII